jgi:hypothetical protein
MQDLMTIRPFETSRKINDAFRSNPIFSSILAWQTAASQISRQPTPESVWCSAARSARAKMQTFAQAPLALPKACQEKLIDARILLIDGSRALPHSHSVVSASLDVTCMEEFSGSPGVSEAASNGSVP